MASLLLDDLELSSSSSSGCEGSDTDIDLSQNKTKEIQCKRKRSMALSPGCRFSATGSSTSSTSSSLLTSSSAEEGEDCGTQGNNQRNKRYTKKQKITHTHRKTSRYVDNTPGKLGNEDDVDYMTTGESEDSSDDMRSPDLGRHSTDPATADEDSDEEYDPDTDIVPGCSSWGLLMSRRCDSVSPGNNVTATTTSASSVPTTTLSPSSSHYPCLPKPASTLPGLLQSSSTTPSNAPLIPTSFLLPRSGGSSEQCDVPERILSVLSSLVEKDNFRFSRSVAVLRQIREQVNEAMLSAFCSMLSSCGIRMRHPNGVDMGKCDQTGDIAVGNTDAEKRNTALRRVAKALSNIAASSNPDNSFRPAASVFGHPSSRKGAAHYVNNYNCLEQVCSKAIFYREIHTVISLYLSSVYIQRAMNSDNTNSSGYPEGMVTKMLNIIGKIPRDEMSSEKYVSVGRDALYLYQSVITDMTGPKHSKRLRTPQLQADFCYVIAMLVNDVPIASDLTLAGKATSLVQFSSEMGDPMYRLAVHKLPSVFNSSYSVYKALGLDRLSLTRADQVLTILSARGRSLTERKPRTLTQSVFLCLYPNMRNKLRASGLTCEESSIGTAVKLVSQQLKFEGITMESLEEGCNIVNGSYDVDGVTLKNLGQGVKDIKTVGLATLMTDRLRKRIRRNLPFY